MPIELAMPALSPTMEKGTLAKWLVSVGDEVRSGDLLAEIETDKATMEFEATDPGLVSELLIPEGTHDVAVGTVIALLSEPGGLAPAKPEASRASAAQKQLPASFDATSNPPVPEQSPHAGIEGGVQGRRIAPADRIKISPLAARIASAKGIDISAISGSGPNGRIVRADLGLPSPERRGPSVEAKEATPSLRLTAPPPAGVPVETEKTSSMRRAIARRLTESKTLVPHFYLTVRCNLDALLALRSRLNDALGAGEFKLSINDLLIKALALAVQEVPEVNVQFGGDVIHQFKRVDVSMAVAIEGGLVTPVLHDVTSLSVSAIARECRALATKAREGKLMPAEYEGGTVSISNLGMFGIDEMVPVINPPQALILGVASAIEQPWKVDGAIALATIMAATASFDHRVIDGAVAARFMSAFRDLVEKPFRILA